MEEKGIPEIQIHDNLVEDATKEEHDKKKGEHEIDQVR